MSGVSGTGGNQPTYRTEDGQTIKFGDNASRGERGGAVADTIGYAEGLEIAMAILNSDYPQLYPPDDPRGQYNNANPFGNEVDRGGFEVMEGALTPEAFYFIEMAKYFQVSERWMQKNDLADDVLFYFFHPELLEEQLAENDGSPLNQKLKQIKTLLNQAHKVVIGKMRGEHDRGRAGFNIPYNKDWKPERKKEEFTQVFERSRAKQFSRMLQGTPQQKNTLQNIYWGFESIDDHPELKQIYEDMLEDIEGALRAQFSIPNDFPIPDIDNSEYKAAMQSNFDQHFEEILQSFITDAGSSEFNYGTWRSIGAHGIPKHMMGLVINYYYNPNMDLGSVFDELKQNANWGFWGGQSLSNLEKDLKAFMNKLLGDFTAKFKEQYGLPSDWKPTPRADTYNKTIETTQLYLIYQYMGTHPYDLSEQGRIPLVGNYRWQLNVPRSVKAELKTYLDNISKGIPMRISLAAREYLNTLQVCVQKELFRLTGANVSDMGEIQYTNPQKTAEYSIRMFSMAESQLAALNTLASQLAPSQNKAILLQLLVMIDQMLQKIKMLLFYIMNEDSMAAKDALTGILEGQLAIAKKQMATFEVIEHIEQEVDEKSKTSQTFADIGKYTAYAVGGAIAVLAAPFTLGASIAIFVMIVYMEETKAEKGSEGMQNAISGILIDVFHADSKKEKKDKYIADGLSEEEATKKANEDIRAENEELAVIAEVAFWVIVVAAVGSGNPQTVAALLFDCGLMHEFLTEVCGMEEPAATWTVFALELLWLIVEMVLVTFATGGMGTAASASKIAVGAQRAANAGTKAAKAADKASRAARAVQKAQKAQKAARAVQKAAKAAAKAGAKKVKEAPPKKALNKIDDIFNWFKKLPKNAWSKISKIFRIKKSGIKKPKKKLTQQEKRIRNIEMTASAVLVTSGVYSGVSNGVMKILQAEILLRRADIVEERGELEAYIIEMLALIKVLQTLVDDLQSGMSDLGNFAIQIGKLQEKIKKMWSESIEGITNM